MYVMNEASIDLPSGWRDQSINVVSSGSPLDPGMTFTVTRDDVPFGMSFDEYLEDQVGEVSRKLDKFELLNRRGVTLDGANGAEIECRWQSTQGPMHQLIYMVPTPGGRAMVMTVTAPVKLTDGQRAEMQRIIQTMRFRKG